MARLRFYAGPMGAGKSTLALQLEYNYLQAGRQGVILTRHDRGGQGVVTSRLGMSRDGVEVYDTTDVCALVRDLVPAGGFVIADEVQFYSASQVDQLALLVDDYDVDVDCFGLLTDFTSTLFAGSARLLELADEYRRLQLDVLCWCGSPGQQNARLVAGEVVHSGEQVVVGDTSGEAEVRYVVLCRKHWRTKSSAHA